MQPMPDRDEIEELDDLEALGDLDGAPVIDHFDGEQFDLVEVMELRDGLIRHHRVYWGWFGLKHLQEGGHRDS